MPPNRIVFALLLASLVLSACGGFPIATQPPTATPAPPTPAPTATITPTPTQIPSPTPTATPLPEAQITAANQALINGDYDLAASGFETAIRDSQDPEIVAQALYGMGRVQAEKGNYATALITLHKLVEQFPNTKAQPLGYFYLGQVFTDLQRYQEASDAYASYLSLAPGKLDGYVQELRGDVFSLAGEYPAAIEAYQAAKAAPLLGEKSGLDLKIGQVYYDQGDYASALQVYTNVYTETQNDYTRAHADLLSGRAFLALNDLTSAKERYSDAVVNFPKAYSSYAALVDMVQNNLPVSEYYRGVVDYYAGQYQAGLAALDRYLISTAEDDGNGLYYKALTLIALDDHNGALAAWEALIQGYPDNPNWATAWDEKAYILWAYLDDYDQAAQTLLDFVETAPANAQAAAELYEAGRIYERAGNLEQAAATWERLINEYPTSDKAVTALFNAGIARYRSSDYAGAKTTFQRMLLLAQGVGDQAAAALWIGKAEQAQGDLEAAKISWRQAAQADPTGYYSERANDLLVGREAFTAPTTIDLGVDLNAERVQAEEWLRTTFGISSDVNLSGLGNLISDPRIIRGSAFWELGLYEKARDEFEDLRQEVSSDPADSYRVMNYFYSLGVYRSAILASRQVLTLARLDDAATMSAPVYFNHVRFGTYFRDLVLPQAQAENVNPLLVFSLMRQESMFEGFVQSSAGARGLMQIMPETGGGIASNLAWPEAYTSTDLYRPVVSVRLGVHYLAQQISYFEGNLYTALAAYNGGPGNTQTWLDLSGEDPDLFLEVVRIKETRDYIMRIYEMYAYYRQLYDRSQ